MPKILYLIDSLGCGGAERQLSLLIKYLPSQWESRIVTLGDGPFVKVLRDQGEQVDISARRYHYDLLPMLMIWKTIMEYRPEIIHTWSFLSSELVAPIYKLLRIKMIDGSIRVGNLGLGHGFRSRITFFLADKIVANTQAGLRAFNISSKKGKVIYNGFDPDRLSLFNSCEKIHDDRFTVVMAARVSPHKDFKTFIETAKALSQVDPKGWKFIILTNQGPKESLIKEMGNLISLGSAEIPESGLEIIPYLKNADVGVLLTNVQIIHEGLSNSIIEYMACGLPVIATNCGGNPEIIREGETGFLIPGGSSKDLTEKLLLLKNNRNLAIKMGESGKKRFSTMFDIERMVSEFTGLYQELISPENPKNIIFNLS
jgi:glycosyltransferase involved in cell wall biosynthesis